MQMGRENVDWREIMSVFEEGRNTKVATKLPNYLNAEVLTLLSLQRQKSKKARLVEAQPNLFAVGRPNSLSNLPKKE